MWNGEAKDIFFNISLLYIYIYFIIHLYKGIFNIFIYRYFCSCQSDVLMYWNVINAQGWASNRATASSLESSCSCPLTYHVLPGKLLKTQFPEIVVSLEMQLALRHHIFKGTSNEKKMRCLNLRATGCLIYEGTSKNPIRHLTDIPVCL